MDPMEAVIGSTVVSTQRETPWCLESEGRDRMGTENLSQYDGERLLTRIDRLSSRVQELEGELESAHRMVTLGTMTAIIVHEFNNILTPILSYAQLALNAPTDHELVERALGKAIDGTEKAAQIASSVLGFVRGEDAHSHACVLEAVREALACVVRDPGKDGIAVELDIPETLQVAMPGISLQQVVLNLVLNARQAIRPGSGTIRIHATCSTWNTTDNTCMKQRGDEVMLPKAGLLDASDDPLPDHSPQVARPKAGDPVVRLSISDDGCGIPATMLERIFEPFVTQRSDKSQGTGLGLPICRQLISQAGGTLTVQSRPGEGTCFVVTLPIDGPQEIG